MQLPFANAPRRVFDFVNDRRRGLLTVATTISAIYFVGKYAIEKMSEMAELARKDTIDRDKSVFSSLPDQ